MRLTHKHGSRRAVPGALALAAVAALLLAGCGGGPSSPGVAHLANSSGSSGASASITTGEGAASRGSGSPEAEALANAACMRSHGVPNFPDPNGSEVVHLRGVDLSSPAFQAAQRACRKLVPNGAKGGGAPEARGNAVRDP